MQNQHTFSDVGTWTGVLDALQAPWTGVLDALQAPKLR
jgi:hypothetical protein